MQLDPRTDILGLIDVQPTFMPGGELPVADGDGVIPVINRLLRQFDHAFATQDWHPANHASFASAHPAKRPYDTIEMPYGNQVLWPDQASPVHQTLPFIRRSIRRGSRWSSGRAFAQHWIAIPHFSKMIVRRPTGLEGWLRQRGFSRLFLCGLATDFCVAWSAEDAARLGFAVTIFEDACRGIGLPAPGGRTTIDTARDRLTAIGVRFTDSGAI